MLTIYNVVASGGKWEDAYSYTVSAFTKEEDAQAYLESRCVLEGQEVQSTDGYDHTWWRNKAKPEWYEVESWHIEHAVVFESLDEHETEEVSDGDQKCEDYVIYDFDPSGIAHPSHCLCPCCELEDEEE